MNFWLCAASLKESALDLFNLFYRLTIGHVFVIKLAGILMCALSSEAP